MADSSLESWSDKPNAPKIQSHVYLIEKANFMGMFTCAASYGIVIILFFRCMSALFNPLNHTKGTVKRLLVAHTVATFLFVTVYTVISLDTLSVAYINHRQSPGVGEYPPGPIGYQYSTYSMTSGTVAIVMFLFNNWLADALLLYRCYIVCGMNSRAIAFPCLLYLATFVLGIVVVLNQILHPSCSIWGSATINVGVQSSVSVSLDVLLTLMIITRLILVTRDVRKSMNTPFKFSGMYKGVITILCESSALYVISFLLWIGAWAIKSPSEYFFFPNLAQTQVIAPFLLILRVTNRRSLPDVVVSGGIPTSSNQRESTVPEETPPGRHSVRFASVGGMNSIELDVRVVATADFRHDKV